MLINCGIFALRSWKNTEIDTIKLIIHREINDLMGFTAELFKVIEFAELKLSCLFIRLQLIQNRLPSELVSSSSSSSLASSSSSEWSSSSSLFFLFFSLPLEFFFLLSTLAPVLEIFGRAKPLPHEEEALQPSCILQPKEWQDRIQLVHGLHAHRHGHHPWRAAADHRQDILIPVQAHCTSCNSNNRGQ